jgi:hypothetical protein
VVLPVSVSYPSPGTLTSTSVDFSLITTGRPQSGFDDRAQEAADRNDPPDPYDYDDYAIE